MAGHSKSGFTAWVVLVLALLAVFQLAGQDSLDPLLPLAPLLALMPSLLAWIWGRQLVKNANDPLLAEKLATHRSKLLIAYVLFVTPASLNNEYPLVITAAGGIGVLVAGFLPENPFMMNRGPSRTTCFKTFVSWLHRSGFGLRSQVPLRLFFAPAHRFGQPLF